MSEEILTPVIRKEVVFDNTDIKSSVLTVSQRNVKIIGGIKEDVRKS